MFKLNYSKDNLKALTFTTCVIGGTYWSRKFFQNKNKENELFKSTSINAVFGVFYGYFALLVNNFITYNELVDVNIIYNGYLTVFGLLLVDIGKDLYYMYFGETKTK